MVYRHSQSPATKGSAVDRGLDGAQIVHRSDTKMDIEVPKMRDVEVLGDSRARLRLDKVSFPTSRDLFYSFLSLSNTAIQRPTTPTLRLHHHGPP